MKESNPFCLLSEVLPDCVKFLSEHPDRGAGVAATKSQLGQHVLLLGESLGRSAIVDEVKGRLTLEALVEGTEVVVEPLPRVYDEDLRILPDPRTLLVCLVVSCSWAQDHDVPEDTAVGAFKEVKDKDCLPAAGLPTDNRRVGSVGSNCDSDMALRASLVECRDESAILDVELCVHDDVEIDVQCAGGLRLFANLYRDTL